MASDPNPQQTTVTWQQVVMGIAGLLIASVPTWIVSCKAQQSAQEAAGHSAAASVQSAENASKIDTTHADTVKRIGKVQTSADTAAKKSEEVDKKAEDTSKKLDKIGAKVGATNGSK